MLLFGGQAIPSLGKKALEEWAVSFVAQRSYVYHGFIFSLENVALPVFLIKGLLFSQPLFLQLFLESSSFSLFLTVSVTAGIVEAFIIWRVIHVFIRLAGECLIFVLLLFFTNSPTKLFRGRVRSLFSFSGVRPLLT